AGIFSWRVDGVTEPRAVRQALPWRHQQSALGIAQGLIQASSVAQRILLPRQNLRSSSLEVMSRVVHCGEVERSVAEFVVGPPLRGVEIRCDFLSVFLVVIGKNVGAGHADSL